MDTSVLVKWFLIGEELTDQARSLLQASLEGQITIYIPIFAYIEFGNVLKTQVKIPLEQKLNYLNSLLELRFEGLEYNPLNAVEALRLSHQYDLSYYDAVFVALAQTAGYDFITADKRLHQKLRPLRFVRFLGEIEATT